MTIWGLIGKAVSATLGVLEVADRAIELVKGARQPAAPERPRGLPYTHVERQRQASHVPEAHKVRSNRYD